ncbi:hypothetical protein GmHk_07G019515 [Glycine max]|nr:hypothetical protein GmHk_07G019515 [Glycine max]
MMYGAFQELSIKRGIPSRSSYSLFYCWGLGVRIALIRHPVDPEKSNRALGFPTLVTGLCQSYRVSVPPSKVMPSDRARKTSSGPGEVQKGSGVSSSGYGPLSVLQGVCRPQQGHQTSHHHSPCQKVLRPQASVGRGTTTAWGQSTVGSRRTATTSKVHLSSSTKAGALPTTRGRPAGGQPSGQVRAGTRPVIDKSS